MYLESEARKPQRRSADHNATDDTFCRTPDAAPDSTAEGDWQSSSQLPIAGEMLGTGTATSTNLHSRQRPERHVAFQLDRSSSDADSEREGVSGPSSASGRQLKRLPVAKGSPSAAPLQHCRRRHHHTEAGTASHDGRCSFCASVSAGCENAATSSSLCCRAEVAALRELALQRQQDLSRVATGLGYEVVKQPSSISVLVEVAGEVAPVAFVCTEDAECPRHEDPTVGTERSQSRQCGGDGSATTAVPTRDPSSGSAGLAPSHHWESFIGQGRAESTRLPLHITDRRDFSPREKRLFSLDTASPVFASRPAHGLSSSNSQPDRAAEDTSPRFSTPPFLLQVFDIPSSPATSASPPTDTALTTGVRKAVSVTGYPMPSRGPGEGGTGKPQPQLPSALRHIAMPPAPTTTTATAAVTDAWPGFFSLQHDSKNNSTSVISSRGTSFTDEAAALAMPFLSAACSRGSGLALDEWPVPLGMSISPYSTDASPSTTTLGFASPAVTGVREADPAGGAATNLVPALPQVTGGGLGSATTATTTTAAASAAAASEAPEMATASLTAGVLGLAESRSPRVSPFAVSFSAASEGSAPSDATSVTAPRLNPTEGSLGRWRFSTSSLDNALRPSPRQNNGLFLTGAALNNPLDMEPGTLGNGGPAEARGTQRVTSDGAAVPAVSELNSAEDRVGPVFITPAPHDRVGATERLDAAATPSPPPVASLPHRHRVRMASPVPSFASAEAALGHRAQTAPTASLLAGPPRATLSAFPQSNTSLFTLNDAEPHEAADLSAIQ